MWGVIAFALICGLLPGLAAGLLLLVVRVVLVAGVLLKWALVGITCVGAFLWLLIFDRSTARRMWREANPGGLPARS